MAEQQHSQRTSEVEGTVLVLISAAGFGTLAILAKLAYAAGVGPLLALNWRFILAAGLLAGYLGAQRRPCRVGLSAAAALLLLGGVGYTTMSTLFFGSLRYIPASAASLLLYTYPGFVAFWSYAFWRTPLRRHQALALVLAAAGTFLLLWSPGLRLNPRGACLGLAAAVVYSFYLLANQSLAPGVETDVAACYIISGAAVSFTVVNLLRGAFTAAIPARGWWAISLMAFLSTAVAITTLLAGIRRIGATTASILSTCEPLVTVLLAIVLLGERLSPGQLLGGTFIASGVLLLHLPGGGARTATRNAATR